MQETARDKQEETETNRDKQTQTETNGLQVKKAATLKNLIHITLFNDFFWKNRTRQPETDRCRQRQTERDTHKQRQTSTQKYT